MKFEDLKLVQKWREYAGPKDERLEAESAKIYKIGFVLLSFGMLMIFFYQFIARLIGQNVCPCWGHRRRSMPLFQPFKFRARF